MAGLSLVAGIGWWDDHRPLPARWRLAVHVLASVVLGLLIWRVGGQAWMGALSALFAVGLVNVWNFMDGINGLATSQAALAAVACALALAPPASWAGWGIAAACLGFLPFNFPRARIFSAMAAAVGWASCVAAVLALRRRAGLRLSAWSLRGCPCRPSS